MDNTNKGTLNVNNRKEKETQPDFKGKINIEGKDYYLSGWKKTSSYGEFTSLAATAVEAKAVDTEEIPF